MSFNINKNLEQVRKLVPSHVTLIGVSKRQSLEKMKEAYEAGLRHFGESTVQEFEGKYRAFAEIATPAFAGAGLCCCDPRNDPSSPKGFDEASKIRLLNDKVVWHFVGHLQTNKVKTIVGKIDYLHSLDSLGLARVIHNTLPLCPSHQGRGILKCFVQVNIGREASKHGVFPEDLEVFLNQLKKYTNLDIIGLMCIPPYEDNPENARPYFQEMKKLAQRHDLKDLSMGMSHDFKVAIEEGATSIRVGEALFGKRQK